MISQGLTTSQGEMFMRRKVTAAALERMQAAWPQRTLTDPEMAEWVRMIGHLSLDDADATCSHAIAELKWFPTIQEFLAFSRVVRRHSEPEVKAQPLTAHIKALQARGLALQRAVMGRRDHSDFAKGHVHSRGARHCPICYDAVKEDAGEACSTCSLMKERGFPPMHSSHL